YYDGYPAYDTDSSWNADFKSLEHNGPRGLGAWLDFAKRHHKKLAIPEWGVRNKPKVAGDNPRYIQRMFEFFRSNASDIAYEAFSNPQAPSAKIFSIYPPDLNPQSAPKYRDLYDKGWGVATATHFFQVTCWPCSGTVLMSTLAEASCTC